ncbi:MAG TPA: hypothetical protein VK975_00800 [Acidimicrobiales bacterium]|nr:hypothetical protein [Acidimicrobiales bacterium]
MGNFGATPDLNTLFAGGDLQPAGENRWHLRCDGRRCTTERTVTSATVLDRVRRKVASGQVVEGSLSGKARRYAGEAIGAGLVSGWEEARQGVPLRVVLLFGDDL